MSGDDGAYAPRWVHSVLPETIVEQRAKGWTDFHPEDFCHRCGRRNPVWVADPVDWLVCTTERERGALDILCPSCFVETVHGLIGQRFVWELRRLPEPCPGCCNCSTPTGLYGEMYAICDGSGRLP